MPRTTIEQTELVCLQGATFVREVVWQESDGTPINLTGRGGRMQVRATVDAEEVLVELTHENGRLSLQDETGVIEMHIDAATTAALPAGRHRYDLEILTGETVDRILQGAFVVDPEVTR